MAISAGQGLALARIGFGLYFVAQALDKTTKGWLLDGGPLSQQLERAVSGNAEAFYRPFLEGTVLPNASLFAQLVVLGEWTAGICLTLGLLTRLGSLIGMWLVTNYMLMKGLTNLAGSNDRMFFVSCLAFALASAGLVWGLDGALRDSFRSNPVTRWLAGIPEERPMPAPMPEPVRIRRERAA
jgi:uncharacterized membrane protein YphA (DoxX/SURF4 family)